ncbi:MAG: type IV secretory system conjugative DNA transfer family protein [Acidobacteriales bacterium]|nr:type IV secretory system conjugative DNA transfer family protein [Terriglobales bacterium]
MSKQSKVIKLTAIGVAVVIYLGVATVGTALGSAALFQLVHKQIPKDLTLTTTRDYWQATADNLPERKKLYLAIGVPPSALFYFLPMSLLLLGPQRRALHGSARFANRMEIQKAGLRGDHGIVLGKHEDKFLTLGGQQSVLLSAPTRSGKGVGIVIPTLLAWAESTVVYDIKGENWAKTAGFRSQAGQICFKFSPVESEHSSRFNPLAEIRLFTDREVSDAQNLAKMLVLTGDDSPEDRYWLEAAESLTVGMILHVCYAAALGGRQASLSSLAGVFARPGSTFRETLTELLNYIHDKDDTHNWHLSTGEPTRTHPVVREKVQRMLDKEDKDFSGVLSMANTALSLYSDPLVTRATSASDFTIQDLVNHERPVSLYLVVPPSDIDRLRPLMRLIFTMIVNRLTEKLDFQGSEQLRNKHRLLFLIDEFPSLKRMKIFADALSYMAGFGLKAYLITQDIRQIVDEYGPNESIVSNCQVRIAFAPNQYDTAELLSKMAGTRTIRKASFNFSGSRMSPALNQMSKHMDEIERPLMTPDEIMRLRPPKKKGEGDHEIIIAPGDMLIFVSGHYPIYGKQMLYFFDPILRSRVEISTPSKFFSIHGGVLSPQDPLPSLVLRPKSSPALHPHRRLPASSGGPGADSPIEQQVPPPGSALRPSRGLLERFDLNSER